jgi:hypothetical protein
VLAQRVHLPKLRRSGRALPIKPFTPHVPRLLAPDHGDCGHDLRQDPHAAACLVGRGLVRHEPKARRQRTGAQARPGSGRLRDGLDDAAPLPPRDGPAGSRAAQGRGRGRRNPPGHQRPRCARHRGPVQERQEPDALGAGRHRRRVAGAQGLRAHPAAPHRQRLGPAGDPVRAGTRRAGRTDPHRRLGRLPRLGRIGLRSSAQRHARLGHAGPRLDARRASRGVAHQAMDPRHPPRIGEASAPGRLPRRVRLSLQPPDVDFARHAVVSLAAAGRGKGVQPKRRPGLSIRSPNPARGCRTWSAASGTPASPCPPARCAACRSRSRPPPAPCFPCCSSRHGR